MFSSELIYTTHSINKTSKNVIFWVIFPVIWYEYAKNFSSESICTTHPVHKHQKVLYTSLKKNRKLLNNSCGSQEEMHVFSALLLDFYFLDITKSNEWVKIFYSQCTHMRNILWYQDILREWIINILLTHPMLSLTGICRATNYHQCNNGSQGKEYVFQYSSKW